MNSKLVVLNDSRGTSTFPLLLEEGDEFVIGRDSECDLFVESSAVSRRHCKIVREGHEYKIEDLDSHNGTFLNNLPVYSHVVTDGDRIVFGDTCVMFVIGEVDRQTSFPVVLDDGSLVAQSFVKFPGQNKTIDFVADLETLAKFGKALGSINDAESLQRRFLQIILEFIPARLGVIGLKRGESTEFQSVFKSGFCTDADNPAQISRTVCTHVLSQQSSLLSNDLQSLGFKDSESLTIYHVTSVLCVPLVVNGIEGLIYLDSTDPAVHFTEKQLHQLTALSLIVTAGLENAQAVEHLLEENQRLKGYSDIETNMIGESGRLREVFDTISKAAPTDATILITGESGTGKELVARAIHSNSSRRSRAYVAINCAVLNENLLESELFGYEKGAFTGATVQKKGKFEIADGGTIFLDEIAELAPNLQAKLLRVLQEREFERVGSTRTIKVDVRIIAATNRSLEAAVKENKFRDDLFFRLNVVRIRLPPLRERLGDIPILTRHFIRKISEKCHKRVKGISKRAALMLESYQWPGNVRELENIIERAVVLGTTELILPEDLPIEILETFDGGSEFAGGFHEQVKKAKREIIAASLSFSKGNYTDAATLLGLHANNLHRLMRNLGMK